MTDTYDYIVLGAGSAGSVVATRLSADENVRVLLLEAGGQDSLEAIHDPLAWPTLLGNPEVDWRYTTVPQRGTAGMVHPYPRGKVLGGSSSINVMAFMRGHRNDYDSWERQGADGWAYHDVLPYFRRMEHVENREGDYRGHDGPMRPGPAPFPSPLSVAFMEAAQELHYPVTPDFNGSVQEGAGYLDLSIADGKRQSTAVAYLHPVEQRRNLTIRTGAQARRLLFAGRRCTGVEYQGADGLHRVGADVEVIVCAGAIDSPRLLLLSGVGPADHLRDVGIETVHDLPGVGRNLHDHPFLTLVVEARQEIPDPKAARSDVAIVWRSDPGLPGPDMQNVLLDVPYHMPAFQAPANSYSMSMTTVPRSRGSLELASADPDQPPLINPNYYGDDDDVRRMLIAIERARELMGTSALATWRKDEVVPGPGAQSEKALRDFIARNTSTYFHPVGSCRMGIDDRAVVDPQLKVHGLDGLRVADASVMPSIPCANTNAPSIMIGEKAADMIRKDHR